MQQLKHVVTMLRMVPAADAVVIPFVAKHLSDGVFQPNAEMTSGAKAMLDELRRMGTAGPASPPISGATGGPTGSCKQSSCGRWKWNETHRA